MATRRRRGALAGLRAGAMSGAVAIALTLGAMTALVLLGGASVQHDLVEAGWMHRAVIAAGVGAGVGVVLGGLAGAILGRLGQMPIVAAITGGALALAGATVFYLLGIHARVEDIVEATAGAAAAGAALGILAWMPFIVVEAVRGVFGRQGS